MISSFTEAKLKHAVNLIPRRRTRPCDVFMNNICRNVPSSEAASQRFQRFRFLSLQHVAHALDGILWRN